MTGESSAADERRLAEEPLDAVDLSILVGLEDLYTSVDPVPADLAMEIKFALTVQALHAEVAELQRSDVPELDDALMRSDEYAQTETMTFTCDQLSAMITVTVLDPRTVRLDGWLTTGGSSVEVQVRPVDGSGPTVSLHASADDDGRFTFAEVSRGMAQFVFRGAGDPSGGATTQRPVITPHVEI